MRFKGLRYLFQKSGSILGSDVVTSEMRQKYNALMNANPKRLIDAITAYGAGYLGDMARIIEEYERRDDKMKTCSKKLRASVARCDYAILKREGFENDPKAEKHAAILRRFWSGVRATDRFKQDEVGGFKLLVKQMMEAESMGYAVHEIIWKYTGENEDGQSEITAEFIKIPLWHFENKTGKLRFLPTINTWDGEDMAENEWMVSTGDGIGMAASICACLKRCTLADWAVFCERCGMPFFIGQTGAQKGSKEWENMKAALAAIGRDARMLMDRQSDVKAIQTGGNGNQPYSPLVEWADRAISCLYRGADLATMSKGGDMAVGATLQGDEAGILEQDCCARMSETLQEKVEKYVIWFTTGDEEPMAHIVIQPMKKPNVDQELKIDEFLVNNGAKLSLADALQRYGRSEADEKSGDRGLKPIEGAKKVAAVGGDNKGEGK